MRKRSIYWLTATLSAAALTLTACGPSAPAPTGDPGDGELAELIAAAQAEGTLTYFNDFPPATNERIAQEFQNEYGITVEYLNLNNSLVIERFAAEATANALSADVTTLTLANDFFREAIDKGWAIPIQEAGLPALDSGDYPEEFLVDDYTAAVQLSAFLILYNEDKLDKSLVPTSLEDLADPKYKDQIVLADPSTNTQFIGFYEVIRQNYGEEWFEGVLANNPKFYPAASAGAQAMMAGEGLLMTPAILAVAEALRSSGAPVGTVTPAVTTGPVFNILLTNPEIASHPNAAKLFANWLLTRESNIRANGDLGVSPFDASKIPSGFQSTPAVDDAVRSNILKLLGL